MPAYCAGRPGEDCCFSRNGDGGAARAPVGSAILAISSLVDFLKGRIQDGHLRITISVMRSTISAKMRASPQRDVV